jgi:hypothetical protein
MSTTVYVEAPVSELNILRTFLQTGDNGDDLASDAMLNFLEATADALCDPEGADVGRYPATVIMEIPPELRALIISAACSPADPDNHEVVFRKLMKCPTQVVATEVQS